MPNQAPLGVGGAFRHTQSNPFRNYSIVNTHHVWASLAGFCFLVGRIGSDARLLRGVEASKLVAIATRDKHFSALNTECRSDRFCAIMAAPKYLTGDQSAIHEFIDKFDVR